MFLCVLIATIFTAAILGNSYTKAETNMTNVTKNDPVAIIHAHVGQQLFVYAKSKNEAIKYNYIPVRRSGSSSVQAFDTQLVLTRPDSTTEEVLCDMSATDIEDAVNGGTNRIDCSGTIQAGFVGTYTFDLRYKTTGRADDDRAKWSWELGPVDPSDSSIALGRVWTEYITAVSVAPADRAVTTDMRYWMVRADGYLYNVNYYGFNGIDWYMSSDRSGIVDKITPCSPAYTSILNGISGTQGETHKKDRFDIANPSCGGRAKIFFVELSKDLPAKDPTANYGWIRPYNDLYETLTAPALSATYTHGGAVNYAGTFHVRVQNYIGRLMWQPIINGVPIGDPIPLDGTLEDDLDSTIEFDFDGKDPRDSSKMLPLGERLAIKFIADRTGEIHFVGEDVELRRGMSVERLTSLAGNPDRNTDKGILFWNDTNLVSMIGNRQARCGWRGQDLSGTDRTLNGINSLVTNGVHGWSAEASTPWLQCVMPGDPSTPSFYGNTNCTTLEGCIIGSGWGDVRAIEDWTYDTTAISFVISPVIRLRPNLTIDKIVSDDRPEIGEEFDYTITVKNEQAEGDGSYGIVPTSGQWTVSDIVDLRLDVVGTPTIKIDGETVGSCTATSQPDSSTLVMCKSTATLFPSGTDNFNSTTISIVARPTAKAENSVIPNTAYVGGGGDDGCPEPDASNYTPDGEDRCQGSEVISLAPGVPDTGIIRIVVGIAGTFAMLGVSAWLLLKKGYLFSNIK